MRFNFFTTVFSISIYLSIFCTGFTRYLGSVSLCFEVKQTFPIWWSKKKKTLAMYCSENFEKTSHRRKARLCTKTEQQDVHHAQWQNERVERKNLTASTTAGWAVLCTMVQRSFGWQHKRPGARKHRLHLDRNTFIQVPQWRTSLEKKTTSRHDANAPTTIMHQNGG